MDQNVGRRLTGHAVNEANDALKITVLDQPGPGGACHLYDIRGFNSKTNPSCPFGARYGAPADHSTILFQNGPIKEVGVNGITNEVLLEVLIDRMEGFQRGPYPCKDNADAVTHLRLAKACLNKRTAQREARGVEGTHQP